MSLAADHSPADLLELALEPTGAPARVLAGDPQTAEHVLVAQPGLEIGVWEVTPGEFASAKPGSGEVMQFLSGEGIITHADGSVTRIAAGSVLVLQPGWTGTWRVAATVRKVYTIFDAVHAGDAAPTGDAVPAGDAAPAGDATPAAASADDATAAAAGIRNPAEHH
ncbi:cupin domain-containing protein [Agromyces salentinus]|uniref:(S)-ureidoglycine aminohydrolase cupin domain-containing protein n=1 Tax=Agromyces salentinus TaxID=269421 RepID=A0ABP4YYX8_9MICO|nr:cupin domain-containing protein [Agromyces salentinus]